MRTVFYSWQSNLPDNTNRAFIKRALQKALDSLAKTRRIVGPPRRIDQDTLGVPGSPDMTNTLLGKIEAADICVFDVSIALRTGTRSSPNPNVMFELGYALKVHTPHQIVLVFNSAFGALEELPFDIRFRRTVSYHMPLGVVDVNQRQDHLVAALVEELRLVSALVEEGRFSRTEMSLLRAVHRTVRTFLDRVNDNAYQHPTTQDDLLRQHCRILRRQLKNLDPSLLRPMHAALADRLAVLIHDLQAAALLFESRDSPVDHTDAACTLTDLSLAVIDICRGPLANKVKPRSLMAAKRKLARRAVQVYRQLSPSLGDSEARELDLESTFELGRMLVDVSGDLEIVGDADAAILRPLGQILHAARRWSKSSPGNRLNPAMLNLALRVQIEPLIDRLEHLIQPS